jgi:hypothetical protein
MSSELKEVPAFTMPMPAVGETVVYYPKGNVRREDATVAFVRHVGARCIEVTGLGNVGAEGVRHVDDPHAHAVPEVRESGLWDFPSTTKQLRTAIAEMKDQVVGLHAEQANLSLQFSELQSAFMQLTEAKQAAKPGK